MLELHWSMFKQLVCFSFYFANCPIQAEKYGNKAKTVSRSILELLLLLIDNTANWSYQEPWPCTGWFEEQIKAAWMAIFNITKLFSSDTHWCLIDTFWGTSYASVDVRKTRFRDTSALWRSLSLHSISFGFATQQNLLFFSLFLLFPNQGPNFRGRELHIFASSQHIT